MYQILPIALCAKDAKILLLATLNPQKAMGAVSVKLLNYFLFLLEKCGDGMNLGNVECDDGNLISGDGCNSNCEVEYGFKCYHEPNKRDYCFDIIPPQAKLIVQNSSLLILNFSEPMKLKTETISHFFSSLSFSVSNLESQDCDYNWLPIMNNSKNFLSIFIKLTMKCSLRGYAEEFTVTFNDPRLLGDLTGNNLANNYVTAKAKKYVYVSGYEKAAISTSGSAFAGAGLTTMILGLAMMLFQ